MVTISTCEMHYSIHVWILHFIIKKLRAGSLFLNISEFSVSNSKNNKK